MQCGVPERVFWGWWLKYAGKIDLLGPSTLRRENARLRRKIRTMQKPSLN